MNITELPLDLQIEIWLKLEPEDLAKYSQVNNQTHKLYHRTEFIQDFFNRKMRRDSLLGESIQEKSRNHQILDELSSIDLQDPEIDSTLQVNLYPRLADLLEKTVKLKDWKVLDLVLEQLKSRKPRDKIAYNSSYWKAFVTALKRGDQFIFLKILDHYSPLGDPALNEVYNQASRRGDLEFIRPLAPYLRREFEIA